MRQTSSLAALVLSTPLARRVERSGTGGGANEKSTPIGVLSVGVIVQKCNLLKSKNPESFRIQDLLCS